MHSCPRTRNPDCPTRRSQQQQQGDQPQQRRRRRRRRSGKGNPTEDEDSRGKDRSCSCCATVCRVGEGSYFCSQKTQPKTVRRHRPRGRNSLLDRCFGRFGGPLLAHTILMLMLPWMPSFLRRRGVRVPVVRALAPVRNARAMRLIRHDHRVAKDSPHRFFVSSSPSSSSAAWAVVPELDDSFPDDYDPDGALFDASLSSSSFEMELSPPDEDMVNPFAFPMPTFSYTEDGNTLEDNSRNNNNNNNNNNNRNDSRDNNPVSPAAFGVPSFSVEAPAPYPSTHDDSSPKDSDASHRGVGSDDDVTTPDSPVLASSEPERKESKAPSTSSSTSTSTANGNALEPEESVPPPVSADSVSGSGEDRIGSAKASADGADTSTASIVSEEPFVPLASVADDTGRTRDESPPAPPVAPLRLTARASDSGSDSGSKPLVPSIESNGFDDLVDSLKARLANAEREIRVVVGEEGHHETPGKTVNLNSPKQVSQLLFGRPDMSTNKETLEGMAGSNILAKLVLEYRDAKRKLNKALKDRDIREERQQLQQKQQQQQQDSSSSSSSSSSVRPRTTTATTSKDPVLLFDTSSFIFRAYYSSPPIHRGRDGMPVGAVMGFCSMMNKLLLTSMLKGETPRLIHCLDAPGSSFRNDLYPDYKAHRPACPLDLVPQFELINKAARAYGMIQIQADGFEADDVIATLATVGSQTEGLDVRILSGDKDLMQLITEDEELRNENDNNNDENNETRSNGSVHMMDPMTSKIWTHEAVLTKWGVRASQLGDVLALAGDKADNVPGVPGIGPKIAASLLEEFETLEALLEQTDKIPQPKRREKLEQHAESARISRELVELKRDLDWSQLEAFYPAGSDDDWDDGAGGSRAVGVSLRETTRVGDLRMEPINADRILAFYDEMGFYTLKQRLLDRLAAGGGNSNGGGNRGSSTTNSSADAKPNQQSSPAKPKQGGASPRASPTASSASASASKDKPKKKASKRNFWEKKTRSIPKPDEYKDVPF